jgi:hypothetical protein
MNFIQTLHFNKSINPFIHSFGWARPEYHLMSWALSCLQLKKLYNKVDLYCNNKAASLLRDELGLPYNNFHISHENLKIAHEKLWALPKILTYSLQDKPFLHLDGDVFLFDKLPASLLSSRLIAQNVEEATDYYRETQKELIKHFSYFPNCVKTDFESHIPIKAVNAGILGGSNLVFIKNYTDLAFEYVNKNIFYLSAINVDRFNVFFEQHLFYSLAAEIGLPIEFLMKDTIPDNKYQHLGDFHEVPCKKSYLHLLGQYKRDEHTCRQMAAKLRQLYPEYYYRIISLFKTKSTPMSVSLYAHEKFTTVSNYIDFTSKAKANFSINSYKENTKDSTNTNSIRIEKKEISTLISLKDIVEKVKDYSNFTKDEIENDFAVFSQNLLQVLNYNSKFEDEYIYGRDLESVNWFCELFGNDIDTLNKIIKKCTEVSIIESSFDWAGLLNQHKRIGIEYYEVLELKPGEFYNLVVPEIFGDGFSLQDMDEMEKIILEHLINPLSVKDLFHIMLTYVEENIIRNHLEEYKELILVMLKQLVLKKAIKPVLVN